MSRLARDLSLGSVAVKLPKHVKKGYECDEHNAHEQHDGRGDLQSRRVVGVEAQHVVAVSAPERAAATATTTAGGRGASPPQARTARPLGGSSRGRRSRDPSAHSATAPR